MTNYNRVVWGALWRSKNSSEGVRTHLINNESCLPALFVTQLEARKFIDEKFGYLRTRPDLRAEPHGWRMPIPVRVWMTVK